MLLDLLTVSATTGVVILLLLVFSHRLDRTFAVKWRYWAWLLIAVRLLVPVPFHLPRAPVQIAVPEVYLPAPAAMAPPVISAPPGTAAVPPSLQPAAPASVSLMEVLFWVWLGVAALFFTWHLAGALVFRRRAMAQGLPCRDPRIPRLLGDLSAEMNLRGRVEVRICPTVHSPMMVGLLRPLMLLPREDYPDADLGFILRHELTHCRRLDLWYKLLMLAASAVHWFNPLVHLMARGAGRDLEFSCDDEVTRNATWEERRRYSEAILASLHRQGGRPTTLSTHFYGGKKMIKARFQNILRSGKGRRGVLPFLAALAALVLAGALVACNLTVPPAEEPDSPGEVLDESTVEPPTPEEQEKIVEQVRAALDAYRNGTVDLTIIPNSEQKYSPKPEGLVLPENVSYQAFTVYPSEMGGFGVVLPSADGGWDIHIWVTNFSYDDGPRVWDWYAVSFLERLPVGTVWEGDAPTNLLYTAMELVDGYFQALVTGGHGVPPSILDYTVKSITFMAGAEEEFAVSASYGYTEATPAPNANGRNYLDANGNSVWEDCYLEFRFRQKAGGGYELVSTGTGGGAMGLARPGTPTDEDIAGYLSILMDQVKVARAVYLAEGLPLTDAPAVDGFRMLDNDPALSPGDPAMTEEARFYRSIARNLHTLEDVRAYLGDPFTADADGDLWAQLFNDRYELYREIGGRLYVNGGVTPADRLGGDWDLSTLKVLEQTEALIKVQLIRTRYQPETVRLNMVLEGGRWLLDESFYRSAA